jgi:hypothetical protein
MRRILFDAVALIVLTSATLEAKQPDSDHYAFNGYSLETPVSNYAGLTQVEHYSTEFVRDVTTYEKAGEVLTLDVVPISRMRYRFADGLLESIQLTYEGRENRDKLLHWVETQYGKLAARERRIIAQAIWHGERMIIILSYNRAYDHGTLWFISPGLHKEINRTTGARMDQAGPKLSGNQEAFFSEEGSECFLLAPAPVLPVSSSQTYDQSHS